MMLLETAALPEPQAASLQGAGAQTEFAFRDLGQRFLSPLLCSRPKRGMRQRAAARQPPPQGSPGKGTDGQPGPNASMRLFPPQAEWRAAFSSPWPRLPGAVCSHFAQVTLLCQWPHARRVHAWGPPSGPPGVPQLRAVGWRPSPPQPPPVPRAADAPGAHDRIAEAGRGAAPRIAKHHLFFFKAQV